MIAGEAQRRLVLVNGRPNESLIEAFEAAGFELLASLDQITVWGYGWEVGPLTVSELKRR